MRTQLSRMILSIATTGMFLVCPAQASSVRGSVELQPKSRSTRQLGFTSTKISAPAKSAVEGQPAPVIVFLRERESLPIEAPKKIEQMGFEHLSFAPGISGCVIDGKVEIVNRDKNAITVTIGDATLGKLNPGESRAYECKTPGTMPVRVKEWPHERAAIFVGEVGVIAIPDARGSFVLEAPKGTYELQVRDAIGVKKNVEVDVKFDVDLGLLSVTKAEP